MSGDPVIVTVAAVGAELTPEQQPALPVTPEQVARDAAACEAAGAAIYHLHVRDATGAPTMDVAAFRAARDAIREATDLIVQFTTGGAVGDSEDARAAPLELAPEMATLTTGSVNFGDDVFANPRPLVHRLYGAMRSQGVLPEFEIFEPGMIANALEVAGDSPDHHLHFDFVIGVPGAMPAWADAVGFLAGHLPASATWSATGIGKSYLSVARAAIDLGGHVRTGLEDVRYVARGELAGSNAQLVESVVSIARASGREPAGPVRARAILGLQAGGG
ncbi:MAG: 3-keto-5-aminohexanoate cleavage protein [Actinomycetota bacterium]|nr:3-keto-5-aminohexanoate cleavage protein [Actinomycetota bacterium]